MEFNVKLYDRVVRRIKNNPRTFVMDEPIADYSEHKKKKKAISGDAGVHFVPSCGTVGCFAGWTDILNRGKITKGNIEETLHSPWKTFDLGSFEGISVRAQKALGLTRNEADELFYHYRWPEPFRTQYVSAKRKDQQVRAALAYFADFRKRKLEAEAKKEEDAVLVGC